MGLALGHRLFSPKRRHNDSARTGMLLVQSCSPQPMTAAEYLTYWALACAALEKPNITQAVERAKIPSPEQLSWALWALTWNNAIFHRAAIASTVTVRKLR